MTTNGRHINKTDFFLKRTGDFAFFCLVGISSFSNPYFSPLSGEGS